METYTMEQFKEMFKKAQVETLMKVQIDFEDADKDKKLNSIDMMTFSMQNVICLTEMYHILFEE